MRDLVQRAILARLCLAEGPNAAWPLAGETAIDGILADDAQREAWRVRWHERLAELGVAAAGGPPLPVDGLTKEDG